LESCPENIEELIFGPEGGKRFADCFEELIKEGE
jgi:hypothetical protein